MTEVLGIALLVLDFNVLEVRNIYTKVQEWRKVTFVQPCPTVVWALRSCAFGNVSWPVDASLPSKSFINPIKNAWDFSDSNESEGSVWQLPALLNVLFRILHSEIFKRKEAGTSASHIKQYLNSGSYCLHLSKNWIHRSISSKALLAVKVLWFIYPCWECSGMEKQTHNLFVSHTRK